MDLILICHVGKRVTSEEATEFFARHFCEFLKRLEANGTGDLMQRVDLFGVAGNCVFVCLFREGARANSNFA